MQLTELCKQFRLQLIAIVELLKPHLVILLKQFFKHLMVKLENLKKQVNNLELAWRMGSMEKERQLSQQ